MDDNKTINFEELSPEIKFCFIAVGQAIIRASDEGIEKEIFLEFCSNLWDTADLNGIDKFHLIIQEMMMGHLHKNISGVEHILKNLKK